MSIPDIISAVMSPIFGILVDRYGKRGLALPFAAFCIICVHIGLFFTTISPIPLMSLLGLCYALFASVIWPCIPCIVSRHQLGTAYGLITVSLNMALAAFPLLLAQIRQLTDGFIPVGIFFLGLAFAAFILSVVLNILDYRNGAPLQKVYLHAAVATQPLDYLHAPAYESTESSDNDDGEARVLGEGIVAVVPNLHRHRHHHDHLREGHPNEHHGSRGSLSPALGNNASSLDETSSLLVHTNN